MKEMEKMKRGTEVNPKICKWLKCLRFCAVLCVILIIEITVLETCDDVEVHTELLMVSEDWISWGRVG